MLFRSGQRVPPAGLHGCNNRRKADVQQQTHQVSYTITVTPGEQYRIKELTAEHLDPAGQAAFDKNFTMKAGELYNPEYVAEFLRKNTALHDLAPYTGNYTAYAHPATHTVDLVVSFIRNNR